MLTRSNFFKGLLGGGIAGVAAGKTLKPVPATNDGKLSNERAEKLRVRVLSFYCDGCGYRMTFLGDRVSMRCDNDRCPHKGKVVKEPVFQADLA